MSDPMNETGRLKDRIAELEAAYKLLASSIKNRQADAIREMLVAMQDVTFGDGYGIVIPISDIKQYADNLESKG